MLNAWAISNDLMLLNNNQIQLRFPSHGFKRVVHNFIHAIAHTPAGTDAELPAPESRLE
jgi:hypothetical protein